MGFEKFNIAHGDTLTRPLQLSEAPFDAIVSNPPYSINWEGDDNPILINDPRFTPAGVLAPKSKADMAFIMHSLYCLDNSGTAAIVCFPGIFYRKGAEKKIRQYLVDNNFVDAVVQLPSNLFFGTSIATCILVLKKNKKDTTTVFIDGSNEFVKLSSKNSLTAENIQNIVRMYTDRKDVDYRVKVVTRDAIAAKDYNLAVSSYVEQKDDTPPVNIIEVNNGINASVEYGDKFCSEVEQLIQDNFIDKIDYSLFSVMKLSEISKITMGTSPKSEYISEKADGIEFHQGNSNFGVKFIMPSGKYTVKPVKIAHQGSILMSVRAPVGDLNVTDRDIAIGRGLCSIEPSSTIDSDYLYYFLSNSVKEIKKGTFGSMFESIDSKGVSDIQIIVPPVEIQKYIVQVLNSFYGATKAAEDEARLRAIQSEYYRDSIFSKYGGI